MLEGVLVVGADLPMRVEFGARQGPAEFKQGISAVGGNLGGHVFPSGRIRDPGLGNDVESFGDSESGMAWIKLAVQDI